MERHHDGGSRGRGLGAPGKTGKRGAAQASGAAMTGHRTSTSGVERPLRGKDDPGAGNRRAGQRDAGPAQQTDKRPGETSPAGPPESPAGSPTQPRSKLATGPYEKELARLQVELVKLQEWIRAKGLKVVLLFEGRDAAGKGGAISRITETLNPRVCRIVALGVPTERERSQWYFQRYVAELPAAGEMVVFDRSWYNRAGVEHVMGLCTPAEYAEFLRAAPEFERMLIRSGIILIKFWFSVSDEEQERRFQERLNNPAKRWKISPMDVQSRAHWVEYSRAKDNMFAITDTSDSPWWVVEADDKKRARLNCIRHILRLIPYQDVTPETIVLPPRQVDDGYVRPPRSSQHFVPDSD